MEEKVIDIQAFKECFNNREGNIYWEIKEISHDATNIEPYYIKFRGEEDEYNLSETIEISVEFRDLTDLYDRVRETNFFVLSSPEALQFLSSDVFAAIQEYDILMSSPEEKIKAMEEKIDSLLKEVEELKRLNNKNNKYEH